MASGFFRVIIGYLAGCVFAIAATSAVLMVLEPGYIPKLDDIVMVAWFVVIFGWAGLLIGIVAEWAAVRSLIVFLAGGLVAQCLGVLTLLVWGGFDVLQAQGFPEFMSQLMQAIAGSGPVILFGAPAGVAAGLGYWLVAGRHSGT